MIEEESQRKRREEVLKQVQEKLKKLRSPTVERDREEGAFGSRNGGKKEGKKLEQSKSWIEKPEEEDTEERKSGKSNQNMDGNNPRRL